MKTGIIYLNNPSAKSIYNQNPVETPFAPATTTVTTTVTTAADTTPPVIKPDTVSFSQSAKSNRI
jgi:hypothetical protein